MDGGAPAARRARAAACTDVEVPCASKWADGGAVGVRSMANLVDFTPENLPRAPLDREDRMTTNRLERTYAATPEEIWELWTTAAGIESWWAPDGFVVE